MMLYIVRHGIAMDRTDPKCPPEPERPLTARGVQKTRSAALGLRALGVKPDALVTSPYVRAAQTAEIFAEALGFSPADVRVIDALKPTGNPAEVVKEILRMRAKQVICFGHAPHLDQMISQLAGARGVFTGLKKAGAACFEHIPAHGRWEFRWLLTPRVLRKLAD
jgi:phosphohistidine phosphatase